MTVTASDEAAYWLEVVGDLTGQVDARRDETERAGQVPRGLVQAMAAAGLFRLFTPRSLGGFEVGPLVMIQVVQALARHDASVAWAMMAGANSVLLAARMTPEGACEVFADPGSVVAGSLHKGGTARRVGGGLLLSGRWRLASGCEHATWLICGAAVEGEPASRPAILIVDRESCSVHHTWDAVGLRGSGTDDFSVEDVFVPDSRYIPPGAGSRIDSPLYRSAMAHFINPPLAAIALGIADDAIDAFGDVARVKSGRGSKQPISTLATVQERFALAIALRDSGREYLHAMTIRMWQEALSGQELSHEATAGIMLSTAAATSNAVEAVNLLYTAAGATSIFETSRLARCFRDVNVVNHHDAASPAVFARVGDFRLNGRE